MLIAVAGGAASAREAGFTPIKPEAGVAITSLDDLPSGAVGVLDEHNGGLGRNLWAGYSAKDLLQDINNLPTVTTSAVARSLEERLLLSMASLPTDAGSQYGAAILDARLNKLMQMESYDNLKHLLDVVPTPDRDETWYKYKLASYFLSGNYDEGCKLAATAITRFSNQYWQEKQLFCLGYHKEFDKAAVTAELMHEQHLAAPDWLRSLLLVWAGKDALPPNHNIMKSLDVVDAAMLGAGAEPLPPELVPTAASHYYLMLSGLAAIGDDRRLDALEKAVEYNRVDAAGLIKLYQTATTEHAKQYQSFKQQFTVEDNVKALAENWQQLDEQGFGLMGAHVYGKDFFELSRDIYRKNLAVDFASAAFSALFIEKNISEAALWLDGAPMENKTAWPVLLALFQPLGGGEAPKDMPALISKFNTDADDSFTSKTKAVLQGFDLLPQNDAGQVDANLSRLRAATASGRRGEMIVIALGYIGKNAAAMPVAAIPAVITGLRANGLDKEALELAHEIIAGALVNDPAD